MPVDTNLRSKFSLHHFLGIGEETANLTAKDVVCRVAKEGATTAMQAAELAVPLSATKVITRVREDMQKLMKDNHCETSQASPFAMTPPRHSVVHLLPRSFHVSSKMQCSPIPLLKSLGKWR